MIIGNNIPSGIEKVTINGEKVKEKLNLYSSDTSTVRWYDSMFEGAEKTNKHLLNNKDYVICNSSVSGKTMTLNLKYIPKQSIDFQTTSERTITTELIGYGSSSYTSYHRVGIHQNSDDTNGFWIIIVFTYQQNAYLNIYRATTAGYFETKCTNIRIEGVTIGSLDWKDFPDTDSAAIYRRLPNILVDSNGVYMVYATGARQQFKFMTYQFNGENTTMKTVCNLNAYLPEFDMSSRPGYLLKKGNNEYYYFFYNTNSFSYVEITRDSATATFTAAEQRTITPKDNYKINYSPLPTATTIYEYNNSFYLFHTSTKSSGRGAELFRLSSNGDCALIKTYKTNSFLGGQPEYDSNSGCIEQSADGRVMSFQDVISKNYFDQTFSIYIITDPATGNYVKKSMSMKTGLYHKILGYYYDYNYKTLCSIYTHAFQYDEFANIREGGYAQHIMSDDNKPLFYTTKAYLSSEHPII